MSLSSSNLHTAWAQLFLLHLARAGVARLFMSPGSRSTPLALAAAAERLLGARNELRSAVIVDERAAAFAALGAARATGEPTALLCTSGTAPAHWMPAVIEADAQRLPLILISADRPWEEQEIGAAQTIDQVKLFGPFVRGHFELGLPDAAPEALRSIPRLAAQVVARARSPEPGPVHLNARFRKPLEPVERSFAEPEDWETLVAGLAARAPTHFSKPARARCRDEVERLAERCAAQANGVIFCGPAALPCDPDEAAAAMVELSLATGYPVLAESASGVRFGAASGPERRIAALEPLRALERLSPALVLEFGGAPISRAHTSALARTPETERHVIADFARAPAEALAASVVVDDCWPFARALAKRRAALGAPTSEWFERWADADVRARHIADEEVARLPALSEAATARALLAALPSKATLVLGNSGPIREVDFWCPPASRALRVLHQRGANGIDGLIAGAAGAAGTNRGSRRPTALLLGDLSALHDLGGFATARGLDAPLLIVLLNNGGGRIFEELPLGRAGAHAEALRSHFVAEQQLDFEPIAALFGHPYARATDLDSLPALFSEALGREGCTLVEVKVAPKDSIARRAGAMARMMESLSK